MKFRRILTQKFKDVHGYEVPCWNGAADSCASIDEAGCWGQGGVNTCDEADYAGCQNSADDWCGSDYQYCSGPISTDDCFADYGTPCYLEDRCWEDTT